MRNSTFGTPEDKQFFFFFWCCTGTGSNVNREAFLEIRATRHGLTPDAGHVKYMGQDMFSVPGSRFFGGTLFFFFFFFCHGIVTRQEPRTVSAIIQHQMYKHIW